LKKYNPLFNEELFRPPSSGTKSPTARVSIDCIGQYDLFFPKCHPHSMSAADLQLSDAKGPGLAAKACFSGVIRTAPARKPGFFYEKKRHDRRAAAPGRDRSRQTGVVYI
jgi:hypothetical protein